ncbi:MAG: type II toxin-antitoxin system HicB family antitoxin [Roseburia sp.]|nr:type II toxin-antitoxin system HicB family antitoxin [Roseburia sp.]
MKNVYPIIITPPEEGEIYYLVYIPDFDINTEGTSLDDALYMARDAIGLVGICMEDDGKAIPAASELKPACESNQLTALIDIDFAAYREKNENRAVRKNCTIPAWLDKKATAQGVNFSAVLQKALLEVVEN